MKSFKTYLTEASKSGKNVHMMHAEDSVIYGGVDGVRQVIVALRSIRNMLAGNVSSSNDVSVKYDGSPAVFCGQDPSDGKFFVAKKGIFNKDPKVYKTPDDVKADTSGDLQKKLLIALQELPKLGIKGVVQGDIMFTKGDLKRATIDGERFITFHPNTIVYAVPLDSDAAKEISRANIGVAWHTRYTGSSFETMKASYGVDVSKFNRVSTVWSQDAMLRDLSGKATMTKTDTEEVTSALSEAGKIFRQIASSTLKEIENNAEFAQLIETYNNSFVRKGAEIGDTSAHVRGLISWIHNRFAKEEDSRSTDAGKSKVREKRDQILAFFSPKNTENLKLVFDLQKALVVAKKLIINQLAKTRSIDTFLLTKDGFKTTGDEGYVAIDHLRGGAVKIVDRMQFSFANFSPDVIKGWSDAKRG